MNERVILLFEDNPNDEALALRALKKSGVTQPIIVVRDGREGLDYLFREGDHQGRDERNVPCVVFLDLNLPKIGGLDVLREIRANPLTRLLPVVVLTSSSEDRDLLAAYQLGTNSYIVKPVDFTRFSETLGQVAAYWLHLNRYPWAMGTAS
jgi:two-component system response regulator